MKQLICDDSGNVSSMRIGLTLLILVAAFVATYTAVSHGDMSGAAALCGTLLMPAFGGKALQKFAEKKETTQSISSLDTTIER